MRKRLQIVLMTVASATSLFSVLPRALAASGDVDPSGSITVSREHGHLVFTNDGVRQPAPRVEPVAARQPRLEYWSNHEKRWKPVPPAGRSIKAARSAAAEVSEMLASHDSAVPSSLPASAQDVDDAIVASARRHNVDPNLVRAVVKVESNFNPHAVSRKGAMGLMQLMPGTARQLQVTNPFDPQQNVDAGVRHLKKLMEDFGGDLRLSLAAYNAGQGAVIRSGGVPRFSETRNYVNRITALYSSGNVSLFPGGMRYQPVRAYRDSQGVLNFTNTE
jgi:soluble lytic murein transglycosylase-like protein